MATPPRPPQQPPRPNPPPPPPKPAAQHEPQRDSHAERKDTRDEKEADPHPDVNTTQEDQLDRSAEIEAMGVEPWKEAHDERNEAERHPAQRGGRVAGVSPTQKDDPGRKP